MPLQARWELENDPDQLAVDILALRAYARTKQAYDDHCDRGDGADKLPQLPLMSQVLRNDYHWQMVRKAAREKDGT